ncbi:MAG: transposase [Dehalococcoidia bacterium]
MLLRGYYARSSPHGMELGAGQTLPHIMGSLKKYTAKKINTLKNRQGHIWRDQYYDHLIRTDESLRDIILYCYENPVRKNLVKEARNYPFWRCKFEIE